MTRMMVSLSVELWFIFNRLKIFWEKGDVRYVFVESDCEEVMNEVNNPDLEFWWANLVV